MWTGKEKWAGKEEKTQIKARNVFFLMAFKEQNIFITIIVMKGY